MYGICLLHHDGKTASWWNGRDWLDQFPNLVFVSRIEANTFMEQVKEELSLFGDLILIG